MTYHISMAHCREAISFSAGALRLKRNDAIALAVKQGATAQTGVTKKTSLVVVGSFSDSSRAATGRINVIKT